MSDYITIPLTQGYETIISVEDSDLADLKWCAVKFQKGDRFYATHVKWSSEKKRPINNYLSRIILERILGRPLKRNEIAEHENNNPLDNRRENIRVATHSENIRNQKKRIDNTSGYKGVYWHKDANKWQAYITVNQKRIHLGLFDNIEDAAKAYAEASAKYHGEFGRLE